LYKCVHFYVCIIVSYILQYFTLIIKNIYSNYNLNGDRNSCWRFISMENKNEKKKVSRKHSWGSHEEKIRRRDDGDEELFSDAIPSRQVGTTWRRQGHAGSSELDAFPGAGPQMLFASWTRIVVLWRTAAWTTVLLSLTSAFR
jgi:hypothetical protein